MLDDYFQTLAILHLVKMFLNVVVGYQHRVINIEHPQVSIQTLPSPGHQGSQSLTIHSLVSSTLYGHSCSLSHVLYHITVSVILISRYQNDPQEMQLFQAARRCHWKTQGSYFFFFFLLSMKRDMRTKPGSSALHQEQSMLGDLSSTQSVTTQAAPTDLSSALPH